MLCDNCKERDSVVTLTTSDAQAVQSRVSAISTAGFTVELDESEIDASAHAAETVHWIAMTQGTSNFLSQQLSQLPGSAVMLRNRQ